MRDLTAVRTGVLSIPLACTLLVSPLIAVRADQSRAIKQDYPVTKLSDRIYVVQSPIGGPTKENQGFAAIVPGHGRAGGRGVAHDYRAFLDTLRATVAKHYADGLSDFEIKPKAVEALARFKGWKLFDENVGRLVSLVYLEVEAEAF